MSEPQTTPPRWVTAAVLQALAQRAAVAGTVFSAGQLQQWLAGALTPAQRVHATTRLCALGFVRHCVMGMDGQRADLYTVTAEGAAAVRAAGSGQVRKSGPKAPHGKRHALPPQSLSARLWALLRMRTMLDAESATATLCDAGGDYERTRASVRRYLRRWADAGAVAESARRVNAHGTSNGNKRFVLVADAPMPPSMHRRKAQAA
jgi:hypothetical protein